MAKDLAERGLARGAERSRSGVRVLVVDDERSLTDLITMALRYEGWDARYAATGAEAVRAIRSWRPDVVVLDVMLPDANGVQLMRRLREDLPDVPVQTLRRFDSTAPTGRPDTHVAAPAWRSGDRW